MGQDRKFISVRMYTSTMPAEVSEDCDAGSGLHFTQSDLGGSRFSVRSKRECYQSDRLLLYPDRVHFGITLWYQIIAVGIYISAIWINIDNWKSWLLFLLALSIGVAKLIKIVWPHLITKAREYWREDDTIS